MKAIACYALHYGKEYLAYSIRSIQTAVDEIHVFYAPKPSYGFGTTIPCPDTEAELETEARRFALIPVIWHRGQWGSEGAHKGEFIRAGREARADMVVCCDADELWPTVGQSLKHAYDQNCAGRWMAWFCNFWRSWNYQILDSFVPIRIVDMRHPLQVDGRLGTGQPGPIYHFGYAQSETTMRYKIAIHGHRAEWRANWLEEKFLPWTPANDLTDLHPTAFNVWDRAHLVSPQIALELQSLMPDHPYRGLEVIR